MMKRINLSVTDQKITYENEQYIVTDSQNYISAQFEFSSEWDGMTKTAVFKGAGGSYCVLLRDDVCTVPHEALVSGFSVSVFGVLDNVRLTTDSVYITAVKSGFEEGQAPSEPTKTVYEELLGTITEIKEIDSGVRAEVAENTEKISQLRTELEQKAEAIAADVQSLNAETDKLSDELNEKADKIKACFLINKAQRDEYIQINHDISFVSNDPEYNYIYTTWDFEEMPVIINEKYAVCVKSGSNADRVYSEIRKRSYDVYFYLSEYTGIDGKTEYELYLTSSVPNKANKADYPLLGTWYWDGVDGAGIPTNVRFVWNDDIKYLDTDGNNAILDVINEMSDINKSMNERVTALESSYGECEALAQEILNGEV